MADTDTPTTTETTEVTYTATPQINDRPTVVPMPDRGEARRREIAALIENVETIAAYRHALYVAYRNAGFTADEALVLCTK